MKTAGSLAELGRHGIVRAAVACGVFDGVHRGHQRIFAALVEHCRSSGATPVALTFEPHPRSILTPDPPPRLTLPSQKLKLFQQFGALATIVIPFSREVACLPPLQFLERFLLGGPVALDAVCVGREWRFGAGAAGDVNLLRTFSLEHGFHVIDVEELCLDGLDVGSTEIRQALNRGELDLASRHLGRNYVVEGTVSRGRGLGGSLFHCPTANIRPDGQMLPADGVYAVRIVICEGRSAGPAKFAGIAYVGTSPTLGIADAPRLLEAHVFDLAEDLYGCRLEVEFVRRLRPDRRFPTVDDLTTQMAHDIAEAKLILA